MGDQRLPFNSHGVTCARSMARTSFPGGAIAVCGIDGSGKTSVVRMITAVLEARGLAYSVVKTPTKNIKGIDYFRAYAANHATSLLGEVDLLSLALLCDADILQLVRTSIIPALERGEWVVFERFIYVSLAEMLANSCTQEEMNVVCALHGLFPEPDMSIITDIPAEIAAARVRARPKEKDASIDLDLWRGFVAGFRQAARENGLFLLGTDSPPEETHAKLLPPLEAIIDTKTLG